MSKFFEYMNFLSVLIGASLWCFGVHTIMKAFLKATFNFYIDSITDWGSLKAWQQTILKPLFACPYCMSSVHGTAIFFMFLFGNFGILWMIPFCVCLCGLNYIVNSLLPEYE